MSDFIFQDHRGQSFDKCLAQFLTGKIIASGFEPRDRAAIGRFWWGVLEFAGGTMEVVCGRVTNFGDGGWGYKIGLATEWENNTLNPPLNVRKAIVKHGLRVKGVYNPDLDNHKFALMTRETMAATVSAAIVSADDAYILEAIAYLGSNAASAAMDFIEQQGNYQGRKQPKVSTAVLRAIAANADEATAMSMLRAMRWNELKLDAEIAGLIYPLLDEWDRQKLIEILFAMSVQQAA